jgi:Mrp family chromosome partitioning ATPase
VDDDSKTVIVDAKSFALEVAPPSPVRTVRVDARPRDPDLLAMLPGGPVETASALRLVRQRLELRQPLGQKLLGVVSARPGEGKSVFAAQLALALSEAQRAKVLLVEANFQAPSLANLLGVQVPTHQGFSVQLARRMQNRQDPWVELALGPSLHALLEEPGVGYAQALYSTHFLQALFFLAPAYDYVVVDGPAVLGSGDANVLAQGVDALLVVARSEVTRGADLLSTMQQLGDHKPADVILWDVSPSEHRA